MDDIGRAPDGEAEEDLTVDLETRLTRLRLRMIAEGRPTAVSAIDKAIASEKRRRAREKRKP